MSPRHGPINPRHNCFLRNKIEIYNYILNKCVSIGYTPAMKDVGLRIRVQRDLREQFLEVCKSQDRPAAQILREFMRAYVADNADHAQEPNAPKREIK